ncbi:MAG: hypothetical protein Q4F13_08845 [Pseudomonadota bacterium]|nr:hypothetical protein [Pseudomonadota bacterium]
MREGTRTRPRSVRWGARAAGVLALCASAVQAQPAETAGALRPAADVATLAATCANCHGPAGYTGGGIVPLYGQSPARLAERLRAFKAGQAPDATVMTRLAKGYDERQIEALAQWFGKGGQP